MYRARGDSGGPSQDAWTSLVSLLALEGADYYSLIQTLVKYVKTLVHRVMKMPNINRSV